MVIVSIAFFIAETQRRATKGGRVWLGSQSIVATEAWCSRPHCTYSQEGGERTNTGAQLSGSILLTYDPSPGMLLLHSG